MKNIISLIRKQPRISKSWYTKFILVCYGIISVSGVLFGMIVGIIMGYGGPNSHAPEGLGLAVGILYYILIFVNIVTLPIIAVIFSVKRLHDMNKSGWFVIIGLFPLTTIPFILYLMYAKGSEKENIYGPKPQ